MKTNPLLSISLGLLTVTVFGCPTRTIDSGGRAGTGGSGRAPQVGGASGTSAGGQVGAAGGSAGTVGVAGNGQAGAQGKAGAGGASGGSGSGAVGTGGGPVGGAGGAAGSAFGSGGAGSSGTAGTGGTFVGSGGSGGAACTNTGSDKLNCGACGHSCLGGDCSAGICQPLLLGTIPSAADAPRQTVVSGGKVYVFTQVSRGATGNAWQFNADIPSTPTEVMTGGAVSCAMNGQLFWVDSTTLNSISACTFSNCQATMTKIVTLTSNDVIGVNPACDASSGEIVWGTTPVGGSTYTIHRATTTGSNARAITSFFLNDGTNWAFAGFSGETDRFFYVNSNSDGNGTSVLYYISTKTVNAAPVPVVTISAQFELGVDRQLLANANLVLASIFSAGSSTYAVVSASLPNGILSGAPPMFTAGNIFGGVIDQTTFYGSISEASSTVPADAVVKCPLTNCSSPTIVARGQAGAGFFTDDATAIYWITSGQAGAALWKAAK